jgi:hypothetical protein
VAYNDLTGKVFGASVDDLILWKSERQRDEWIAGRLHPYLSMVFLRLVQRAAFTSLKCLITVTDIYRSLEEDVKLGGTGIHCAWRAIDIAADSWQDPVIQKLTDFVNETWLYDPARPELLVALFAPHESATGPHLHLQTHEYTRQK